VYISSMRYALLCLLLSGCFGKQYPAREMLNKAEVEIFEELLKAHELNVFRCRANNGKKITCVSTDYFCDKVVDMMTARSLLHTAVEQYSRAMSENFEMKPFLKDGVIERRNIECTIFFRKGARDINAIASVSLLDGKVRYSRFDKESGVQCKIHEEKYE